MFCSRRRVAGPSQRDVAEAYGGCPGGEYVRADVPVGNMSGAGQLVLRELRRRQMDCVVIVLAPRDGRHR